VVIRKQSYAKGLTLYSNHSAKFDSVDKSASTSLVFEL